jgi:cell division septal protein FtsQ
MAPREALALVRDRSLLLASSLPSRPSRPTLPSLPRLRRPERRTIAVAAAVALAVPLAYLIARETPVFAVRAVEVRGSGADAADVRALLAEEAGGSLVAVDADGLAKRLGGIPSVRSASVDRAFPHTLVVVVEAERPLAVVRTGGRAWVVAETGRVIEEIESGSRPRLPGIGTALPRPPELGETLVDPGTTVTLHALRLLSPRLSRDVRFARVETDGASLVLRDGVEVRLGEPAGIDDKIAAAAAVLRALRGEERAEIGYLDASVPERVVAGAAYEVSGESLGFAEEVPAN